MKLELDRLATLDGFIFVLDSQRAREIANRYHLEQLRRDLNGRGIDLDDRPLIFQANKRDLPGVVPVDEMVRELNIANYQVFESIATQGIGTEEAFEELLSQILSRG